VRDDEAGIVCIDLWRLKEAVEPDPRLQPPWIVAIQVTERQPESGVNPGMVCLINIGAWRDISCHQRSTWSTEGREVRSRDLRVSMHECRDFNPADAYANLCITDVEVNLLSACGYVPTGENQTCHCETP
jgi:hypothetical protein